MPELRKAYWRFDRDQTNRVSTERIGRSQPEADRNSPVVSSDGGGTRHERPPIARDAKNASRLRAPTDGDRPSDKISYPDPAAAPLGTDDEAAGTPAEPVRIEIAAQHESPRDSAGGDFSNPDRGRRLGMVLMVMAAVALAVVGVAALLD